MFNINKRAAMKKDDFDISYELYWGIDANVTHWSKNIAYQKSAYLTYYILLKRKVSQELIRNAKLDKMPGFRFTWNYNTEILPDAPYINYITTEQFIR